MTLFADLPGTFTIRRSGQHADLWTRDLEAILVEQDLAPFGRYAGWVPVSRGFALELVGGSAAVEDLIEGTLGHVFRPWNHHDEPDFLDFFEPTPRLSHALELVARVPILARSSKRRWDVLDDAAYIAARRLRRAADRLDARFETRRAR